jgi:hypothetical protein
VVTGSGTLESITIDPGAVDPEDVEMLQDLIVAAVNEGLRMVQELQAQSFGGITSALGGMGGGGLGGLGGLLGGMLGGGNGGTTPPQITPEQAAQLSPEQVQDIAQKAEQENPGVVERMGDFYAEHPNVVKGLGGAALAIALAHMASNIQRR